MTCKTSAKNNLFSEAPNSSCGHPLIKPRQAILVCQYKLNLHAETLKEATVGPCDPGRVEKCKEKKRICENQTISFLGVMVYRGVGRSSPWVASLRRSLGTSSSAQTLSYQRSLPLGRTCEGSLSERGRHNTVRIMGDNVSYLTP